MEAIVDFDYTAKESDELSIRKGEIIKDVIDRGGGWCEGTLENKRGMFPDNFVRILGKGDVTLRQRKDVSRIRQCRVLFSYKKDHEDELNLNVGDIVDVTREEEEGWWRGILGGKEGVFPSNFVEEINASKSKNSSKEDLTSLAGEADWKTPSLPPKPIKILCEVKYSYKAQNCDELTFKEGDIITLISKEGQDPGWWKGELNGDVGVFPDNFVIIIPSSEENSAKEDKKTEKAAQEATPKRQNPTERSDESTNKITPPVPGKKPIIPIKKSPSGSSSSGGLFSGLKKKIADAVDGASISKSASYSLNKNAEIKVEKHEDNPADNAFDQVERNAILQDVRATRVKAPGRRPPSVVFKEGEPGVVNGNTEHSTLDVVSETVSNSHTSEQEIVMEVKPRVREWEKHKAPWLEEMKLNQAKRTSTSPGPEQNKLKLTPDKPDEETKSNKTSPFDTPSPVDMSKSMPVFPSKLKTPPNELEKNIAPMIRTKPMQPVTVRPQTIHSMAASNTTETTSSIIKHLPSKMSPNISAKLISPGVKPQIAEKNMEKASGDVAQETVPLKQYVELLQRIEKLESLVERQDKQNHANKAAIEELKGKLQVETDMRMLLQAELEKVSQCVMQV